MPPSPEEGGWVGVVWGGAVSGFWVLGVWVPVPGLSGTALVPVNICTQ